jgi:hypothetical protein
VSRGIFPLQIDRLNLAIYPYLPRATVATTTAKDYLSLLAGGAAS